MISCAMAWRPWSCSRARWKLFSPTPRSPCSTGCWAPSSVAPIAPIKTTWSIEPRRSTHRREPCSAWPRPCSQPRRTTKTRLPPLGFRETRAMTPIGQGIWTRPPTDRIAGHAEVTLHRDLGGVSRRARRRGPRRPWTSAPDFPWQPSSALAPSGQSRPDVRASARRACGP